LANMHIAQVDRAKIGGPDTNDLYCDLKYCRYCCVTAGLAKFNYPFYKLWTLI